MENQRNYWDKSSLCLLKCNLDEDAICQQEELAGSGSIFNSITKTAKDAETETFSSHPQDEV